jgi:hypothetical protein
VALALDMDAKGRLAVVFCVLTLACFADAQTGKSL